MVVCLCSSLISNCHWFAVDSDQYDNVNYVLASPIADETDDVVMGKSNELLDTPISRPFSESEEPENAVLVNSSELENSEQLSKLNECEKSHEWVEWRETSGKVDIHDLHPIALPNGIVDGDRGHIVSKKPIASVSSEDESVNKQAEKSRSSNDVEASSCAESVVTQTVSQSAVIQMVSPLDLTSSDDNLNVKQSGCSKQELTEGIKPRENEAQRTITSDV